MTPEDNQRMIHIRIDNEVHRELRKVAAEFDVTIQEIVSRAVEQRVKALEAEARMEQEMVRLERRAHDIEKQMLERLEPQLVESEQGFETGAPDEAEFGAYQVSVVKKLEALDNKIEAVLGEITRIHQLIDRSE